MSFTGNKGEWSELYTLFKLLSNGVLEAGDESLNKIADSIYPIVKIIREEVNQEYSYSFDESRDIVIISSSSQAELIRVSVHEFSEQALLLLGEIKKNSGSFEVAKMESFMSKIYCSSIKAGSNSKTDITIQINDVKASQNPVLGFSIKSQLGGAATLLNAGKTTNFVYKIHPELSAEQKEIINGISGRRKIKDRVKSLALDPERVQFNSLQSIMFQNNLRLIDSLLPEILSKVVYKFYSSDMKTMEELVRWLEETNPLEFDNTDGHKFYTVKIKRFLTDVALGMMPSKCWTGKYQASGGYLIVKEDGEVVCYHLYDRNLFENYLLNNTKLETASSGRYQFGSVYTDNGQKIKLNLQIRFIK